MKRHLGSFIAVVALVFGPALLAAQTPPKTQPAGRPDLVAALAATPGCLGVEAARTIGGKQVIFAWFENKQAVLNWYNSEVHRTLMNGFGGARRPDGPLAGVNSESGPILAIASLTMEATAAPGGDLQPAISQIAIELYAPLPGGISVGGRFAPASLKVPGMVDLSTMPSRP
jgi:antibiotic biosynthesis monooxygenase